MKNSVNAARSLHFTVGQNNAKPNADASTKEYKIIDHEYDAVVVGAGKIQKSIINNIQWRLIFLFLLELFKVVLVCVPLSV